MDWSSVQAANTNILKKFDHYKKEHPGTFSYLNTLLLKDAPVLLRLIGECFPSAQDLEKLAREFEDNLEGHPKLYYELSTAYDMQSFRHLFERDGIFFTGSSSEEGSSSESDSVELISRPECVQVAFEEPYRGNTHKIFLETLNEYRKGCTPYNWSILVAQSSGKGKTRMVEEAAKMVFAIPTNIHLEWLNDLESYPPPDRKFRDYIRHKWPMRTDLEQQAEFATLLRVLFDKTAELVATPRFFGKCGEALAALWAEYLNNGRHELSVSSNREKFMDGVVEEAHMLRRPDAPQDNTHRASDPSWTPDETDILDQSIRYLKQSCKRLVDAVSPGHSNDSNACLVYFDRAEILFAPRIATGEGQWHSLYDNLMTVLTNLTEFPIFFIFVSRRLPLGAPIPQPLPVSSRYLFPPFTNFPLDVFAEDVIRLLEENKPITLESLCKTEIIVGLGRALWYPYHKQWLQDNSSGLPIIDIAHRILTMGCGTKSRLGALSTRIRLELNYGFQPDQGMGAMITGSHPLDIYQIWYLQGLEQAHLLTEPILAEAAAAHIVDTWDDKGLARKSPRDLARAFEKGLLAQGDSRTRGQICGRLLVTAARDIALEQYHASLGLSGLGRDELRFHRPVPVLYFLRSLFAEQFHKLVLEAKLVTDTQPCSLQEAFKESFVFFSHFGIVENSEALTPQQMAAALHRGMALYVRDTQNSVHAVIPVHIGSTSSPLSPRATSAINLQFHNRKRAERSYVDRRITVPDFDIPALSIIFELGSEDPERPAEDLVQLQQVDYALPRNNEVAVRYDNMIVAYGHGSATFGCIQKKQEKYYDSILGISRSSVNSSEVDDSDRSDDFYGLP